MNEKQIALKSGSEISKDSINREHRLARQSANTAIQHAIRCGEMLTDKKKRLKHGKFKPWIEVNCEFSYRQAAKYMKLSKVPPRAHLEDYTSINEALGYDRKESLTTKPKLNVWAMPIHPFNKIFPMVDDAALQSLATDISRGGQVVPIIIGMENGRMHLIDGKCRLEACRIAGIEPKYEIVECDYWVSFINSMNFVRANYNESQLGFAGLNLNEHVLEENPDVDNVLMTRQ